jgi:hypothetical protein
MHTGVIILVKAKSRAQAIKAAENFLEPYGDNIVWDWYQIGGRWTGTLTGYDPEKDPRNHETCDDCDGTGFRCDSLGNENRAEDPTYTCNGCGLYDETKKVWVHGPLGPGRRVKWPGIWVAVDDNAMPLSDDGVAAKVRELARDSEKDRLAENFGDGFDIYSYVFDAERETHSLPCSFEGYWAVMVDMHN